jgi:hypothetical protein
MFYGLIGGVLGVVLLIVLYYLDIHPFLIAPFFDFRIALFGVFIYFTLKELRDYNFGGLLFFWQGLIACGIFVLTFGVITALLLWIFALNVPAFVTTYVELATNQLKSLPKESIDQIGHDVFDKSLKSLPNTTPLDLSMLYFVQCLQIGLFISIILSVILRRQPGNYTKI